MERSQFLPSLPSCLWGMNHVESGVRPLECAALECISACGPAMDGTRSSQVEQIDKAKVEQEGGTSRRVLRPSKIRRVFLRQSGLISLEVHNDP